MNNPGILIKTLVIASSVTLAGSFVLYRSGALGALLPVNNSSSVFTDEAYAATVLPDTPFANPSRNAPDDDESKRRDDSATRRTFFPGSKSGVFLSRTVPDTTKTVANDSAEERPRRDVFMGGSKSLAPLVTPPAPDTVHERRRRNVFMGGSKSLAPLVTPPEDSSSTRVADTTKRAKSKR